MFCSNCGKTVLPDAQSCPHCGMELGDVRFAGMPYTSVQFRIVPGTPMPIDEAYSYTRTNYSVNIEDGEAPDPVIEDAEGDAVDSATTYRPVLRNEVEEDEEDLPEEDEPDMEAPVDVDVNPDDLSEEQINAALNRMRDDGLDADQLTETVDYSEELVSDEELGERLVQYESEMRADQERRQQKAARGRIRIPFMGKKNAYEGVDDADEAYGDAPEEQPYEPYDEGEPAYGDAEDMDAAPMEDIPADGEYAEGEDAQAYENYEDYGDEGEFDAGQPAAGSFLNMTVAGVRMANILKIAGALVIFVICLVLGLKWFGYVSDAQQKSPIDGVTLSLHTSGIEMIKQNASDEKKAEMLSAYSDQGVVAFTAMQTQRTDALSALMPTEPGVNDQVFMDALKQIQTNIANAVIMDAMSGSATSDASEQNWAKIANSITALENATDVVQLQAITNQTVEVITATPTPAPTVVSYPTLARGDESDDVMKLQQRLFELGYLADAADGKFGNKTTTAVKYFQMAMDLPVTGIADSATQSVLFSDEALDEEAGRAAYQARQAEANE